MNNSTELTVITARKKAKNNYIQAVVDLAKFRYNSKYFKRPDDKKQLFKEGTTSE